MSCRLGLLIYLFGNITDWLTTYIGLAWGLGAEANPIVAKIVYSLGMSGFLIAKMLVLIPLWLACRMWRRSWVVSAALGIAAFGIAAHNLYSIFPSLP